ncbi:MAG TPA: type II toxin-antitoxin system RelE/ParE family toxin [Candidatus Nanoarchaeia archaeon]|nr:type II toxin-antitoxin system RelE/ParE family toxin [Candidatus Nanoarchaeia archaeon]
MDRQAVKFLEGLPSGLSGRIAKKLRIAASNPFFFFEHLEERSDYKLRVGDYRLIADIDRSLRQIHVTKIGHRKNVYD